MFEAINAFMHANPAASVWILAAVLGASWLWDTKNDWGV